MGKQLWRVGFSTNKQLLVENHDEETISALRCVNDAVRHAGIYYNFVTEVDVSYNVIVVIKMKVIFPVIFFNLGKATYYLHYEKHLL